MSRFAAPEGPLSLDLYNLGLGILDFGRPTAPVTHFPISVIGKATWEDEPVC